MGGAIRNALLCEAGLNAAGRFFGLDPEITASVDRCGTACQQAVPDYEILVDWQTRGGIIKAVRSTKRAGDSYQWRSGDELAGTTAIEIEVSAKNSDDCRCCHVVSCDGRCRPGAGLSTGWRRCSSRTAASRRRRTRAGGGAQSLLRSATLRSGTAGDAAAASRPAGVAKKVRFSALGNHPPFPDRQTPIIDEGEDNNRRRPDDQARETPAAPQTTGSGASRQTKGTRPQNRSTPFLENVTNA